MTENVPMLPRKEFGVRPSRYAAASKRHDAGRALGGAATEKPSAKGHKINRRA